MAAANLDQFLVAFPVTQGPSQIRPARLLARGEARARAWRARHRFPQSSGLSFRCRARQGGHTPQTHRKARGAATDPVRQEAAEVIAGYFAGLLADADGPFLRRRRLLHDHRPVYGRGGASRIACEKHGAGLWRRKLRQDHKPVGAGADRRRDGIIPAMIFLAF